MNDTANSKKIDHIFSVIYYQATWSSVNSNKFYLYFTLANIYPDESNFIEVTN